MEDQKDPAARALAALDQITQEAYEKTGGDIYGTEPPAEPPVDSQPATEPPAEGTPAASPDETLAKESTSEPARLYFGKYKTIEEAERGYWESTHAMNSAKAEADTLRRQVEGVKQATGTTPAEQDPLDEIESYGVPRPVIEKVTRRIARDEINAMFGPAIEKSKADQTIITKYPEYQERFGEIEKFVEASPEIAEQVTQLNGSGNYLAARQIAYLNWKVSQANAVAETKAAAESARKEEVKDARRDAGVGATRRADTRTAPVKPEVSKDEEKRLLDLYKAGHQAPYLRHKLDSLLPPNFDEVSAQVLG